MNELNAYKITKGKNTITIITHKFVRLEDPDHYLYDIYSFVDLTQQEMKKFSDKLRSLNTSFKLIPKADKWEIRIKEVDIDNFRIGEPEYKDCTKEQLIMLLNQKNIQIQNIRFQSDNLHKAYSKLYHLYEDSKKNKSNQD